MLAATYLGPRKVRAENVPDAALRLPTDCIVRSSLTAICGSDLHTYHGANEKYQAGAGEPPIMGHEFVGVVEEIGLAVTQFKKGDRVTGAFRSACGRCDLCRRGYPAKCPYGELLGLQTPGAQAEAVRVGFADFTLASVPDKVPDEFAIFAGDNLSTGMQAASYGQIQPGDTVAVFGCGPVGLFAQQASFLHGASVVFAIDRSPARLELAHQFGSTPISASNGDAVAQIREATGALLFESRPHLAAAEIIVIDHEKATAGTTTHRVKTDHPTSCPHGRPIALRYSWKDIQKAFNRI